LRTTEPIDPAVTRTAWAVIVGALAVVFDTTIVSVALRTLAHTLHASVDTIQWISTAYLLALGVTIPIVGWAQRRVGGKTLWLISLAIFLAGSILCSLAWNATSLILFRVIQGVGGGIMLPLLSTLIIQAAGGRNLGQIMATISLPAVLGPIVGPVIGGLILQHLSWPWLFWVNVPFCVAGFILAVRLLPNDPPAQPTSLDTPGLLLITPAIVGMLYGLSNVAHSGGLGRGDVLIPLIGGLLLLSAFIARAWHRSGQSLINVRLLTHWPLASSSLLLFLSGVSLYGALFLLPLDFQEVRGADALGAGVLLISQGVGTLLSRTLAGRLSDSIGARWVTVMGFTIVTLGTLPFAFADAHTNVTVLIGALAVRGFGLGAVTIPLMALAFSGLQRSDVPDASIITRIATQLGGSFGTALLAVILQGAVRRTTTPLGTAHAFDQSFWWAIGFSVLATGVSLLLPQATKTASTDQRPKTN